MSLDTSTVSQIPHIPVMCSEALEKLIPLEGTFIDATFGRGGYTKALLQASPHIHVIAFDRDKDAIAYGRSQLSTDIEKKRLRLVHDRFSHMSDHVKEQSIDGVVLDLGLSSPQLDDARRGFSFLHPEAPLDMQMGLSEKKASDFLNHAPEAQIVDILFTWGGERRARPIAKKIVHMRKKNRFEYVKDLLNLFPPQQSNTRASRKGAIHPATRTFQALRMWVNDEIDELEKGLLAALKVLRVGGRLVAITFHSGEDRIVKHFLKPPLKGDHSRFLPAASKNTSPTAPAFQVPKGQPLGPSLQETNHNPRSRSAKLRWAVKTTPPPSFLEKNHTKGLQQSSLSTKTLSSCTTPFFKTSLSPHCSQLGVGLLSERERIL